MRLLPLLLLAGCGHVLRGGAGPLVDSCGRAGIETSFEIGTHLVGAKDGAATIGLRVEASATRDGAQGVVGLAYGATLLPGGKPWKATRDARRGWGGKLAVLGAGAVIDDDLRLGMRAGLAVTRGWARPGGYDSGGCSGHEKSSFCYGWRTWRYAHTGIELATALTFVEDDDHLTLDGWRVAAEFVYERGTLTDLEL